MIDTALAHGAGVFVLALTSNKEGPEVQHARTATGRSVGGSMLDELARQNAAAVPLGSLGAVVGATIGDVGESFEFNGPILAPGVGAQGGTLDDVRRIFGAAARNVLPSTSRDVLQAGPDVAALRERVRRVAGQFAPLVNL
jgi:orotidine-5'-phosphate decarboxylase